MPFIIRAFEEGVFVSAPYATTLARRTPAAPSRAWPCFVQEEVATALESFFRVGAPAGGKTNDRFDALMQASLVPSLCAGMNMYG